MLSSKIISIGDEILIGQIVNTNAAYISEKLYSIGIPVKKIITIGDTKDALLEELEDSMKNFDVTIITGGLGPTHDDITKPILVEFFKDELVSDEKVLNHVNGIFKNRNIPMPDSNFEQALVPKKSKIIWNKNGTAPGIWMKNENKIVVALPGVPFEMRDMMLESVLPMLSEEFKENINYVLKSRTILTTGIGESSLAEMIGDVNLIIGDNKLAFLPSLYGVRLRIDVKGEDINEVEKKLNNIENSLRKKIERYIFGTDDDLLESKVGDLLAFNNLTLSVAESCTGGLLSSMITDISGSSRYFKGGLCVYSNEAKINLLGVQSSTIEKYGAVSEETALEMAENVRKKFFTNYGLSITGIAGPAGGSESKPVGLVWIGYSDKLRTFAVKHMLGKKRDRTKIRSVYLALDMLKKEISNLHPSR
jgi:nicotinamide-nucleotide amidase